MKTVIVSGALANKPFNGGNAWSRLGWALGFRRLGFEVCFVETIEPDHCVDAAGAVTSFADSVNLAYFRAVMERFGLSRSSALICGEGKEFYGLSLSELVSRAQQSVLLFNISGHLTHPEIRSRVANKVYYDDDPGFTQFWQAAGDGGARLEGHDAYFTLGANIGASDCRIPAGDIGWHHTRPPVVLEEWPMFPRQAFDRFTTVASWRGAYGPVEYAGRKYGLKVHEFRKFVTLPHRSGREFEVALGIHPADQKDLEALLAHGWRVIDPRRVAGTPRTYRDYVQSSGAEFSVAQGIYVDSNSGWFSDRTARYLASGKPALVQDTGISRHYPVGEGLIPFRTMEEALEGAERIAADYGKHCRAARRLAEEYFDSDKVIGSLTTQMGWRGP